MNDLSNKYALAALKARRGSIAGQITDYEARLRRLREATAHIHGTVRLFDEDIDPGLRRSKEVLPPREAIRPKELNG
jgi:hypothetical protein